MGAYKFYNPTTQQWEIIKSKSIIKDDGSLEYTPDDIQEIDNKIGNLSTMPTTEKTNLAGAVGEVKNELSSHKADNIHVPKGLISMWYGLLTNIPDGWTLCDGQNGTPDLRDRFIVGAGNEYEIGDIGGEKEVTLTEEQIPNHRHGSGTLSASSADSHSHSSGTLSASSAGSHSHSSGTLSTNSTGSHTHTYYMRPTSSFVKVSSGDDANVRPNSNTSTDTSSAGSHSHSISGSTSSSGSHSHSISGSTSSSGSHSHSISGYTSYTGSGRAHENRPPYFALAFIMKL